MYKSKDESKYKSIIDGVRGSISFCHIISHYIFDIDSIQYSTVQYSTVQYSTVLNLVQFATTICHPVQYITIQDMFHYII